jgi:hypothetical protein
MSTKTAEFEFFKDIPKDKSVTEEALAYGRDFNECKGLLPAAAMPSMLGVSRQRWHQIKHEYDFKIYHHFDKEFVSYPVAMEYCKLHRPSGPRDPAGAIKAIMADMVKD